MRVNRLWAATLVASGGCSIVAVRPGPSVNERTGAAACATHVAPALDVAAVPAFALLGAGINSLGRAIGECGSNSGSSCGGHWEVYIPAAIAAASAIYGFWAVHHCDQELDAMHAQYLKEHPGKIAAPDK